MMLFVIVFCYLEIISEVTLSMFEWEFAEFLVIWEENEKSINVFESVNELTINILIKFPIKEKIQSRNAGMDWRIFSQRHAFPVKVALRLLCCYL